MVQALAATVPLEHGGDAQRWEALADQLLKRPDVVALRSDEQDEQREQRWTTLELLATEFRALDLAGGTRTPAPDREKGRLAPR